MGNIKRLTRYNYFNIANNNLYELFGNLNLSFNSHQKQQRQLKTTNFANNYCIKFIMFSYS
jgi:hypothetical protein